MQSALYVHPYLLGHHPEALGLLRNSAVEHNREAASREQDNWRRSMPLDLSCYDLLKSFS